jgi:uncharacterized cupin superfamily protein
MNRIDLAALTFEQDPGDPEGFRGGMARLGPDVGAQHTGGSVYELPPGQAVCPYHYELGEEEWVLVLQGQATVRTPDGETEVGPDALLFFPTGPTGAHQVHNAGEETVRILMWSNVVFPTATVYPDSDKVGLYTRDGGDDLIVRRSSRLGYFEGEER